MAADRPFAQQFLPDRFVRSDESLAVNAALFMLGRATWDGCIIR